MDEPSRDTVLRCTVQVGCAIEYDVALHISFSKDLWVGIQILYLFFLITYLAWS